MTTVGTSYVPEQHGARGGSVVSVHTSVRSDRFLLMSLITARPTAPTAAAASLSHSVFGV